MEIFNKSTETEYYFVQIIERKFYLFLRKQNGMKQVYWNVDTEWIKLFFDIFTKQDLPKLKRVCARL